MKKMIRAVTAVLLAAAVLLASVPAGPVLAKEGPSAFSKTILREGSDPAAGEEPGENTGETDPADEPEPEPKPEPKPEPTIKLTAKNGRGPKGILLKWTKVSGATHYVVQRQHQYTFHSIKKTKARKIYDRAVRQTRTKTYEGNTFVYRVIAYKGSQALCVSKRVKIYRLITPRMQQPIMFTRISNACVYWGARKKAGGYQIRFINGNKSKIRTIKGWRKNSCRIPGNFTTKTRVQMRSWKKIGKVKYYSAWGDKKNIKIIRDY